MDNTDFIVQDLETVWQEIEETAVFAGLDPTKFSDTHREIVAQIVQFLAKPPTVPTVTQKNGWGKWLSVLNSGKNGTGKRPSLNPSPPAPIIICGEPGTGKTTFLNVLDVVLRRVFNLPDNIQSTMHKGSHEYQVTKRLLNGRAISLLSVKKWSDLLHFYTWDRNQHGLIPEDRTAFIQTVLQPMRLIFADEVEMTGYAPTLPDLARHGLLVVGTSNQHCFAQLEEMLVRNRAGRAELSREALAHMKITIHAARGVPEAIKVKTAVGIDRATSRIGQAGHKAHQNFPRRTQSYTK